MYGVLFAAMSSMYAVAPAHPGGASKGFYQQAACQGGQGGQQQSAGCFGGQAYAGCSGGNAYGSGCQGGSGSSAGCSGGEARGGRVGFFARRAEARHARQAARASRFSANSPKATIYEETTYIRREIAYAPRSRACPTCG